jgi:hypothetical protein
MTALTSCSGLLKNPQAKSVQARWKIPLTDTAIVDTATCPSIAAQQDLMLHKPQGTKICKTNASQRSSALNGDDSNTLQVLGQHSFACALLRLDLLVDCFELRVKYLDLGRLHVETREILFAIPPAMLALSEIAN